MSRNAFHVVLWWTYFGSLLLNGHDRSPHAVSATATDQKASPELCDLHGWYLDRVADGVFEGPLSSTRQAVKKRIETLIARFRGTPGAGKISCSTLATFENMLEDSEEGEVKEKTSGLHEQEAETEGGGGRRDSARVENRVDVKDTTKGARGRKVSREGEEEETGADAREAEGDTLKKADKVDENARDDTKESSSPEPEKKSGDNDKQAKKKNNNNGQGGREIEGTGIFIYGLDDDDDDDDNDDDDDDDQTADSSEKSVMVDEELDEKTASVSKDDKEDVENGRNVDGIDRDETREPEDEHNASRSESKEDKERRNTREGEDEFHHNTGRTESEKNDKRNTREDEETGTDKDQFPLRQNDTRSVSNQRQTDPEEPFCVFPPVSFRKLNKCSNLADHLFAPPLLKPQKKREKQPPTLKLFDRCQTSVRSRGGLGPGKVKKMQSRIYCHYYLIMKQKRNTNNSKASFRPVSQVVQRSCKLSARCSSLCLYGTHMLQCTQHYDLGFGGNTDEKATADDKDEKEDNKDKTADDRDNKKEDKDNNEDDKEKSDDNKDRKQEGKEKTDEDNNSKEKDKDNSDNETDSGKYIEVDGTESINSHDKSTPNTKTSNEEEETTNTSNMEPESGDETELDNGRTAEPNENQPEDKEPRYTSSDDADQEIAVTDKHTDPRDNRDDSNEASDDTDMDQISNEKTQSEDANTDETEDNGEVVEEEEKTTEKDLTSTSSTGSKVTRKGTIEDKETEGKIPKTTRRKEEEEEEDRTNSRDKSETSNKLSREDLLKIETLFLQKAAEQAARVQSLEILVMKLENQVLSHRLQDQNGSSHMVHLENQILRIENELLKLNQSYAVLHEENEILKTRQNKHLALENKARESAEAAATTEMKNGLQALPSNASEYFELVTAQQEKLKSLTTLLKNQSELLHKLHARTDRLEEQNQALHNIIVNQTALISHVMHKLQEVSEENLKNRRETSSLKSAVDLQSASSSLLHQLENILDEASPRVGKPSPGGNPPEEQRRRRNKETSEDGGGGGGGGGRKTRTSAGTAGYEQYSPVVKPFPLIFASRESCSSSSSAEAGDRGPRLCLHFSVILSPCPPHRFLSWARCQHMFREIIDAPTASRVPHGQAADRDIVSKAGSFSGVSSEKLQGDTRVMDTQQLSQPPPRGTQKEPTEGMGLPPVPELVHAGIVDSAESSSSSDTTTRSTSSETPGTAHSEPRHTHQLGPGSESTQNHKPQQSNTKGPSTHKERDSDTDRNAPRDVPDMVEIPGTQPSSSDPGTLKGRGREDNEEEEEEGKDSEKPSFNPPAVSAPNQSILPSAVRADDGHTPEEKEDPGAEDNKKGAAKPDQTDAKPDQKDGTPPDTKDEKPDLRDVNPDVKVAKPTKKETDEEHPNVKNEGQKSRRAAEQAPSSVRQNNAKPIPEAVDASDRKLPEITNDDVKKSLRAKKRAAARQSRDAKYKKVKESAGHNKVKASEGHTNIKRKGGEEEKKSTEREAIRKEQEAKKAQEATRQKEEAKKAALQKQEVEILAKKTTEAETRPLPYWSESDRKPKDCYDLYKRDPSQARNGAYKVFVKGLNVFVSVYCDMKGGGWTLLLKREDGSVDFYRDWDDYANGFGTPFSEHYLGNEAIHYLTNQDYYKLQVDLKNWKGETRVATYRHFWVDADTDNFRLHILGYNNATSTAGDGLSKHDGMAFSTRDRDHDLLAAGQLGGSCAQRFKGAGWYYKCYMSNLMGVHYAGGTVPEKRFDGVAWKPWTGPNYSLKEVVLKVRPRDAR